MSEKQRIDSFIDIHALNIEARQAEKLIDDLSNKIKAINAVELRLSNITGTKESVKAIKDLQDANNGLISSQLNMNKVLNAAVDAKERYNGSTESHLKNADKLATATLKEAKAAEANAKAAAASAKAREIETRYTAKLQKESEKLSKQREREQKILDDLTNDYKLLSKAYEDQALKAKNYAIQLGKNHPLTLEAAADAQRLQKELSDLDAMTGRYTRNVGNYTSATTAMTQVLREAPAFANSFATGISGISNNVPMLTDEFKKLKDSGLSTVGALKVLGGALFSFAGLLPIAFLLIQTYGKEIAEFGKSLFGTAKQMDVLKESQTKLNEAFESTEYADAVQLVDELRINIGLAKDGMLDKTKVVKQYNESIGQVTGEVKNLDEAEKALAKNADAYVQMMLYKAAANLSLEEAAKKAFEAEKTRLKSEKEFSSFTDFAQANTGGDVKVYEKQKKEREAINKKRREDAAKEQEKEADAFKEIGKKFQTQAATIAKDFNFDFFGGDKDKGGDKKGATVNRDLKAQYEITKRSLEEQIKLYEALAAAEGMSAKSRTDARQKASALTSELFTRENAFEIAAVQQKLAQQLKDEDLTAAQILTLRQNAADEIANINSKTATQEKQNQEALATDLLNIWQGYKAKQKKQLEDDLALFKDNSQQRETLEIQAAQNSSDRRTKELSRGRDIELKALEEKKSKGLISEEDYNKERLRIETDYNILILRAQLDFVKKSLEIKKSKGKDVTDELKRIAELELQIERDKNDKIKKLDQDRLREQAEKFEKIKTIALEVGETIKTLFTAGIEKEKNEIRGQMDLLEEKKEKEIAAAQATTASQEEKAAKVALINARAQSQKESLERRQRQLDVQRAQFEKAFSITKVIADTAAAIMNQLASGDPYTAIPRSIVVGALGAAQLARVIATPIPKYAEGTEDHPGGLAIVGDGGRKEMVITPDGKTMITPNKPTLMDLPKHTIVVPDLEAFKASAFANLVNTPVPVFEDHSKELVKLQKENTERLIKAIQGKKELHLKGSHAGVVAMHKWGQNWVNYINENTQF